MDLEQELIEALREFRKRDVNTFVATVKSVDKEKGICLVEDEDLEYVARMSSVINGNHDRFYLLPKIGSIVLVSPIEEDINFLYIDKYSEVEELSFRVAESYFSVDGKGFNFKKDEHDLKSLILELIAAIRKMKFTTNAGPTIKLINESDFLSLEDKFKDLLKTF